MEYTKFLTVLLISLINSIFPTALGIQQKYLPDLRRFRVEGMVGRFVANRDALERELQNQKQQDAFCEKEVILQLPQSLPHSAYDTSHQGEVMFFHETITDDTLASELSVDLKEQIATSYQFVTVAIPVVIGNEKHSALHFSINSFTNSTKRALFPYLTNVGEPKQVDSIGKAGDGTVTIRLGDDVMVYQVQDKVNCNGEKDVGKDFDKVTGEVVTTTTYPLSFDWGCEFLNSQISFCQVLDKFQCQLAAVGGDICALTSTSTSERSPKTMVIVSMTGIFREMFPFLAETMPNESFEAELIDREHTTGIKYPCLV